jgi:hypothetical protein
MKLTEHYQEDWEVMNNLLVISTNLSMVDLICDPL